MVYLNGGFYRKEKIMKVAIVGAGQVGSALGNRLAAKGHDISFGVRNDKDSKYDTLRSRTKLTTPAAAVKDADAVILATPWTAARKAVDECGGLSGKILIDCTNPIKSDFTGLEVGHTTSGAEMIAGWAPDAKVVKCFNHTGAENMNNPDFGGTLRPVMFAAGDDDAALQMTVKLAQDVGFDAVGLKGLRLARQLEQLAWLWIDLAIKQGQGRDIAFALLRR
jgi:predicted dinucleotide-binding enzyme